MGVTVADARFMKPLDTDLIRRLAAEHQVMLTVEENAVGGFGAHVLHFMALDGLLDQVRFFRRKLLERSRGSLLHRGSRIVMYCLSISVPKGIWPERRFTRQKMIQNRVKQ